MMTVGIVADNYKIEKFKEELTAKGFTFEVVLSTDDGVSTIKVETTDAKFNELSKICKGVELHFKRSN